MKRKNQKLMSTGRLSGSSGRGEGVEFVYMEVVGFDNGLSGVKDVCCKFAMKELCEGIDVDSELRKIGIDQFQPGSGHGSFGSYGSETGNGIAHQTLQINNYSSERLSTIVFLFHASNVNA
jgi:hypothetical protein